MPIVWTHADGSVEVTQLVEGWLQRQRGGEESTEAAVTRLAERIRAKAPHLKDATMRLVKSADMPTSREDRAKWRLDGDKVKAPEKPVEHGRPVRPPWESRREDPPRDR